MNQFIFFHMKGDQLMVCEGILNYFGTSSEELLAQGAQKAREIYEPQIQKLTSEKDLLFSEINSLSSENNLLSSKNNLLSSENNLLSSKNNLLSSENNLLSSENILFQNEINTLKHLLEKNSIAY